MTTTVGNKFFLFALLSRNWRVIHSPQNAKEDCSANSNFVAEERGRACALVLLWRSRRKNTITNFNMKTRSFRLDLKEEEVVVLQQLQPIIIIYYRRDTYNLTGLVTLLYSQLSGNYSLVSVTHRHPLHVLDGTMGRRVLASPVSEMRGGGGASQKFP